MHNQIFIIVMIVLLITVAFVVFKRLLGDVDAGQSEHVDQRTALDLEAPQLSTVEQCCLQTLQQVAGTEYYIRHKLTLGEICPSAKSSQQLVDFSLYGKKDSNVHCVVQLQNPATHHEADALAETLEQAGIALYLLPRKSSYSILKMRETLQEHLKKPIPSSNEMISTISMQSFRSCPQCQSQMKLKRSTSGSYKGALFWVCAAYPDCDGVELYTDKR
ncbi:MAG: DUF2726 domain-containing protein [Mariprofundus sp.]|nr:DUF2726 domain-containing protein [Mariprofundus sp.]